MKKKRKRSYSVVKQENTINIVIPVVVGFAIIGSFLIFLGSLIRKNELIPNGNVFSFLNGLIQKINETGELIFGLGIAILIISGIVAIVAFFIKRPTNSHNRYNRYDRW